MSTDRRITTDVHVRFRLEPDGATWLDHLIVAPDGQEIAVRVEQVTAMSSSTRQRIQQAFGAS